VGSRTNARRNVALDYGARVEMADGTMKLIIRLTGGQTDAIVTLIANAAAIAVESGEERITHGLLERARNELPEIQPEDMTGEEEGAS